MPSSLKESIAFVTALVNEHGDGLAVLEMLGLRPEERDALRAFSRRRADHVIQAIVDTKARSIEDPIGGAILYALAVGLMHGRQLEAEKERA